ncbi:EscU/YscU/HrcU family type III secretion system export apparatus switch protein [Marinobacter gelidimuriae]|uniref:EscU/YscU/HrcU family type III secretion system export apparatus switch protein n=1 Tax=Marinobacter gelidimuriae TaxID=2739064 RepID=UPI0003634303|nr:EscU/YscU/HrcU family type III secretion system export apparatus switch protein [Marinobacter gelidimuriae]
MVITLQQILIGVGLGFASMVDLANGVNVAVLAQIYTITITLLFLAMNGHLVAFEVFIESFRTLPIGLEGLGQAGVWQLAHRISWMFVSAMLMALPAVTAVLIVSISFGVMTRAAPQMNIFALGFPIGLVLTIAILILDVRTADLLAIAEEPTVPAMEHVLWTLGWSFFLLSCATIIIAVIDVPFQIYDHQKKLKMTMQDVPTADVVITSPTHYAVALKYDQNNMGAPMVVAKGGDELAFKIMEIARENKVEILRTPPLARAVYHNSDIGQEIPDGLYMAIAQVLAYVFQLRQFRKGHADKLTMPNFPIPSDLRRDT